MSLLLCVILKIGERKKFNLFEINQENKHFMKNSVFLMCLWVGGVGKGQCPLPPSLSAEQSGSLPPAAPARGTPRSAPAFYAAAQGKCVGLPW